MLTKEQIEMKKAKWGLLSTLSIILVVGCLENDVIYWQWVGLFLALSGVCLLQFIKWCRRSSKNAS